MEMLPPAPVPPNVVVGATVVKRFPGYGERRGTIAEIDLDGGKVVVRWASDERTTLSLGEAAKRALYAIPPIEEEERSIVEDDISTVGYDSGDDTAPYLGEGGARTSSSRFWGVTWDRARKKWKARYLDADGKTYRTIGRFDDEEEAARAYNKAIRDASLEGKRHMNAVDATGALVPKVPSASSRLPRDRAAVVAPDPARAPTGTTSKFWGVSWNKSNGRWQARYQDADGKLRSIGYFDTQEAAAHAVNAAIRRAGLEGRRKTNPVVDGQLVPPKKNPASGHGRRHKRRRDEPAAAPSTRARRR
ncbi:unnamed protein product [Pelagomonas calceolata]|uniref:AP2/ERF domain-containing protein n=1 Tax=Pelagomonas calceolata TaxID=35677 RepID=A0A8J2WWH6_9STRA|nr:unnamed protein product [Pelagomonas calceolata]